MAHLFEFSSGAGNALATLGNWYRPWPRTWAVWVRFISNPSNVGLTAMGWVSGNVENALQKPAWSNQWRYIFWDGSNYADAVGPDVVQNVWTLLTCRMRANTTNWYEMVVTGYRQDNSTFTTNTTNNWVAFWDVDARLSIGGAWNTSFAQVECAHAAAWDQALTDDEIRLLAGGRNPSTVRQSALLAYWPLQGDLHCKEGRWRPALQVANERSPIWVADPPRVAPYLPRRRFSLGDLPSAPPPVIARARVAWFGRA